MYDSKWFAFKSFDFLADKDSPVETVDSLSEVSTFNMLLSFMFCFISAMVVSHSKQNSKLNVHEFFWGDHLFCGQRFEKEQAMTLVRHFSIYHRLPVRCPFLYQKCLGVCKFGMKDVNIRNCVNI